MKINFFYWKKFYATYPVLLRLGGPEPMSLKKFVFTHINGIFHENKNPNNILFIIKEIKTHRNIRFREFASNLRQKILTRNQNLILIF